MEDKSLKRFPLFFQKSSNVVDMASPDRIIYEFGNFRLIPSEGLLLQNGEPVALSLKAFATLVLLVERHGHLVGKSELIESVWTDAFVEEAAVSRCVWAIRNALGEDSKSSTFIQTISRRGYRFVAPVSVLNDSSDFLSRPVELISTGFKLPTSFEGEVRNSELAFENGTAKSTGSKKTGSAVEMSVATVYTNRLPSEIGVSEEVFETPTETFAPVSPIESSLSSASASLSYAKLTASIAGIILITTLLGYYGLVQKSSSGSPRSIAVLPIAPINPTDRNVLYEVGIADSLINRLSSAEGVIVRPLNAVRAYAETAKDPVTVGREQKADYVVASNYQISDGKIKITAQVYNVVTGNVEDTFTTQRDVANVFTMQDTVAAEFGNKLMARFGFSARSPVKGRGTNNEEAYSLYQQGMYLIDKRGKENVQKALECLERAVALDPNYARAWAGLALAFRGSAGIYEDQGEVHRRSMEAANHALGLDPDLSEARGAVCLNKLYYEYDFPGAEASCKQAIMLDSKSPAAHQAYSAFLITRGKHDEALSELKAAIDLEPASFDYQRLYASDLYLARRFDEAAASYRRLLELEPNDAWTYNWFIRTLEAQGKEAEAFEWFLRLLDARKQKPETIARFKTVYQESGWRGILLERAGNPSAELSNNSDFRIAGLYASAGEDDKAFEYLEKAYDRREYFVPLLQVEPQLDPIREDPRYNDLVRRVEGK
jgi:serine/threonine-protein kinase